MQHRLSVYNSAALASHTEEVEGIAVHSPFAFWPPQRSVVQATLQACRAPAHALIDAPTGTGKTLALLTAISAWIRSPKTDVSAAPPIPSTPPSVAPPLPDEADFAPLLKRLRNEPPAAPTIKLPAAVAAPEPTPVFRRVFYLTRTHAQVAQVIAEARRLRALYEPPLHITVLASRSHLCTNPRIASSPSVSSDCRRLLAAKAWGGGLGCPLEPRVPQLSAALAAANHPILDVEQLAEKARSLNTCAFFGARNELVNGAELVVCPYNYVIDPAVRGSSGVVLSNTDVFVFDEGHNLPDLARSVASLRLTHTTLSLVLRDLTQVGSPAVAEFITSLATWLKAAAKDLAPEDFTAERNSWRGNALRTLLRDQLGLSCSSKWPAIVEGITSLVHPQLSAAHLVSDDSTAALSSLISVLSFMLSSPTAYDHFAVVVKCTLDRDAELAILCLWPGVVLRPLASTVRAILLASGSLAPFDALAGELGLQFTVRQQAPHVVPPSHLFYGILGSGVTGKSLELSYRTAEALATQDELGATVLTLARTAPNGMLCFLPSYGLLSRLIARWESTRLLAQLRSTKRVFIETSDARTFDADLAEFYAASQKGSGALFFAVCRGKLSEGMNCADHRARLVVVAGVPFSAVQDEAILLKRAYNTARATSGGGGKEKGALADGNTWYTAQAAGAAAQAVGRVVRHAQDWGAVLLIDPRFKEARLGSLFPTWLRAVASVSAAPPQLIAQLSAFFATHAHTPAPAALASHSAQSPSPSSAGAQRSAFPTLPPARPGGSVVLRPKGRPEHT